MCAVTSKTLFKAPCLKIWLPLLNYIYVVSENQPDVDFRLAA